MPSSEPGVHRTYELSGSSFEIGQQHGRALPAEIVTELSAALKQLAVQRNETTMEVLAAFRARFGPVVESLLPGALEEVRGVADGAGLSVDAAFFASYRDGTPASFGSSAAEEGCTAFACVGSSSVTRGAIIGQTKDTGAPLERYRMMRLHDTEAGRRHILCTYPGWAASWGLLSDGALAWVGNSLYGLPPSPDDDTRLLPTSILKRLAMQHTNLSELRAELSSRELLFTDGAFTFADRSGAVAVLECVAGRNVWRDVKQGWAVHANHALLPALIPHEDKHGGWGPTFIDDSKARQARLEELLAAEPAPLGVSAARQMLGDRSGPGFPICSHEGEAEIMTTAAYVVDLAAGDLWVAIGPPDSNEFERYAFDQAAAEPRL